VLDDAACAVVSDADRWCGVASRSQPCAHMVDGDDAAAYPLTVDSTRDRHDETIRNRLQRERQVTVASVGDQVPCAVDVPLRHPLAVSSVVACLRIFLTLRLDWDCSVPFSIVVVDGGWIRDECVSEEMRDRLHAQFE
jgi:hypothetical protein